MSIELCEAALRRHFGAVCAVPVCISHRDAADADLELTAAEQRLQDGMGSVQRRQEYLAGRSALKSVLAAIGRDTDTSAIVWPDPHCSLSHSQGHAVAVSQRHTQGIGIDLQLTRRPGPAVADRILSGSTLAYWQALPESGRSRALQRFWTVNESVYKACPAPQPAYFRHYRMEDPDALDGTLSIEGSALCFRVHTAALEDGFVSLAYRI